MHPNPPYYQLSTQYRNVAWGFQTFVVLPFALGHKNCSGHHQPTNFLTPKVSLSAPPKETLLHLNCRFNLSLIKC